MRTRARTLPRFENSRAYMRYTFFVYRYIMYTDSRPFSMFDSISILDIYTCVYMCVCIRACGVLCLYVFMYSCVRMFIYVYYVYHYKYECMRVDKCVRCIQRFETNCLRVRRFFFFFLVHFFFSCVFSRVIASRLEKLNIPCIHIYACLYICVCIQLKGTRC